MKTISCWWAWVVIFKCLVDIIFRDFPASGINVCSHNRRTLAFLSPASLEKIISLGLCRFRTICHTSLGSFCNLLRNSHKLTYLHVQKICICAPKARLHMTTWKAFANSWLSSGYCACRPRSGPIFHVGWVLLIGYKTDWDHTAGPIKCYPDLEGLGLSPWLSVRKRVTLQVQARVLNANV